ncbi:MAG TPA: serine hydrolase, partial [Woeseiaceae bacterium]
KSKQDSSGLTALLIVPALSPVAFTGGGDRASDPASTSQEVEILHHSGYGSDLGTRVPISADSAFNLASVSKQFTAMAILVLAECGERPTGI